MILLFQSWLQSLKFFLPNNFIPFFLVTIKSWLEVCKKILTIYFCLLLIAIFSILLFRSISVRSILTLDKYSVLFSLLIIIYIISIRPSVDIKYSSYYETYIKKSILLFIVLTSIFFVFKLNYYLISPIVVFSSFFYLDTPTFFAFYTPINIKNFFKSFYRCFLLTLYNLPFILISYLIFGSIFILISFFTKYISSLFFQNLCYVIILFLFLPFYLTWLGCFYFKRVHDQFNLYFKK